MDPDQLPPTLDVFANSSVPTPVVLNFAALRGRCLGNESLLAQVLARLESVLQPELAGLQQAAGSGDHTCLAAGAHRLKGTLANVGAEAGLRAAEQLESAARRGDRAAAQQWLIQLQDEVQRLLAAVAQTHQQGT
jgi:HPt (histidine-containing phosphotransfer) domain-containing protein